MCLVNSLYTSRPFIRIGFVDGTCQAANYTFYSIQPTPDIFYENISQFIGISNWKYPFLVCVRTNSFITRKKEDYWKKNHNEKN